jgi:hypothetical protein
LQQPTAIGETSRIEHSQTCNAHVARSEGVKRS